MPSHQRREDAFLSRVDVTPSQSKASHRTSGGLSSGGYAQSIGRFGAKTARVIAEEQPAFDTGGVPQAT